MAGDQITVAELLARRAVSRKNADAAGQQDHDVNVVPRRHRNIEHGGVSVAELTGSIPKITDEHLANGGIEEPQVPVAAAEDGQVAEGQVSHGNGADPQRPAGDVFSGSNDDAFGVGNDDHYDDGAGAGYDHAVTGLPDGSDDQSSSAAWSEDAWVAETEALLHDVITGHADEDDTSASDGSDYSVDDHAVEEGARAEEDSQGFARRGTTPSTEVTRNLQQVTDDDIAAGNAYPQDDGSRGSGYPSDYRNDRDGYDRSGLAGGSDAVPARGVTGDSNGRHDTGVTSEKMNIGLMIIEVIVALVLGVIVFRCFTTMWVTYSRPVTTVVAMVVTGAIVGAVHAILRERDKPIMLLAAVVGLALTCGPYLVVT